MSQLKQRQIVPDIARAIVIFFVVYVHAWESLVNLSVFPSDHPLQLVDYAPYLWGMPLFFLLAGYNAAASLSRTKPREFILRRASTIIPIYLIWSAVQLSLQIARAHFAIGGEAARQHSFYEYLYIFYQPIEQFWFLYVLMICHVVAALLNRRPKVLMAVAAIAFLLNQYGSGDLGQGTMYNGFFYVGGFMIARHALPPALMRPNWLIIFTSLAVYLGFVALGWTQKWDPRHPLLLPGSIAGMGLIMVLAKAFVKSRFKDTMIFVGMASLAIYVLHVMFIAGSKMVLNKLGYDEAYTQLAVTTLVGFLGPLALYALLKRLKLLRYAYLG